ncbi:MAG: PilZ domain-containing protein [Nitrospira sp.]|nr:PilZ domain-containing protein [Nitrospira sp.]MDP3091861.1 PilZ domain-containing protein [Nitrospira sp.]
MKSATMPDELFLDIREHTRMRVPVPFSCALAEKARPRWFAKKRAGLGVVYDVSLKGARVTSEAPMNPGDQVTVLLRLPKQVAPLAVERATVRWAKDNTFGLEFMHLTSTAAIRLQRFLSSQVQSVA